MCSMTRILRHSAAPYKTVPTGTTKTLLCSKQCEFGLRANNYLLYLHSVWYDVYIQQPCQRITCIGAMSKYWQSSATTYNSRTSQESTGALPTCNKLCSCQFSSGQKVIHGALFCHWLQVQPSPVVAIIQLAGVALQMLNKGYIRPTFITNHTLL